MKIGIVGSRSLTVCDLGEHIDWECDEIISGGAKGIDTCAAEYARKNGIKLTIIPPDYEKYGKAAPIIRNREIVKRSDRVIAIWDGASKGTLSVINLCKKFEKPCLVIKI